MIITSREKPREIALLEGNDASVHSLYLSGCPDVALALFQAKNLSGTRAEKEELARRYDNNPLALKIVSSSIKELFNGKIQAFLSQKSSLFFGAIRQLFESQFNRLSSLEKTLIYWLTIDRDWDCITDLQAEIIPYISTAKLLAAIESLKWRGLIESRDSSFTLQPIFMDYVSERFEEQIIAEIIQQPIDVNQFHLLKSHALINNRQRETIQEAEKIFLIQPCIKELINTMGSIELVKTQLNKILVSLGETSLLQQRGYLEDNINNLLLGL